MKLNKGFTIIELSVAMIIFSTVIVGLIALIMSFFQNFSFSFSQFDALNNTQSSVTRIVRDIREARMGENGAWPIADASDNSFSFYSDVTNDGKSDLVRYFLDGSDLKRGVIEPSGTPLDYDPANEKITIIASDVDNAGTPIFTYYNGDWPQDQTNNPLQPASRQISTRYVSVYLKINSKPDSPTGAFELTGGVSIRSMKNNL